MRFNGASVVFRMRERARASRYARVSPSMIGRKSAARETIVAFSGCGRLLAEQGIDERGRLKWCEVVGPFAQTDELDRHSEFLLDAKDDTALGRAVQLG